MKVGNYLFAVAMIFTTAAIIFTMLLQFRPSAVTYQPNAATVST